MIAGPVASADGLQKQAISGTIYAVGESPPERTVDTPSGRCQFWGVRLDVRLGGDVVGMMANEEQWHVPCDLQRPHRFWFVRRRGDLAGTAIEDAVHLEQLATYGDPRRDPRGRVVTVAYLALAPDLPTPQAGGDAAAANWTSVADLLADPRRLAFDHHRILIDGVERARAKLEYTPLGAAFCREEFTIAELRRVYEAVWGAPLDPRNFHRKVTGTPGFVLSTQRRTTRDGGRPAQLYTRGEAAVLYPPLLRPAESPVGTHGR